MRSLSYTELPLTIDSRQVFTVDVVIDSIALPARVESGIYQIRIRSSGAIYIGVPSVTDG